MNFGSEINLKISVLNSASLKIQALKDMPEVVVSVGVSDQSKYALEIVEFLKNAGADAELLHFPDYGVFGNGHR